MNWTRLVCSSLAIMCLSTTALALQGVIEQEVKFGDALQTEFASFDIKLERDGNSANCWAKSNMAVGNHGLASSLTKLEVQSNGYGNLSVSCMEDCEKGNFNNGEGMQVNDLTIGETISKASPKVSLALTDSHGTCEVEVRQKTWHKLTMTFNRNDADNQDKVFDFSVTSVDVSQSTNHTALVWSGSTATSTTSGGSLTVAYDGGTPKVQVGGSWSQAIAQGVNSVTVVSEGDYDRKATITLGFGGQLTYSFAISVFMTPKASIADNNSYSYFYDISELAGKAEYATVIGMGKITLIKNNDRSDANRLVRFNGAQLGDPRRTYDVGADQNPKIVDLTK